MDYSSQQDFRVGIVAEDMTKTTNRRRGSVRVRVTARVSVVRVRVRVGVKGSG